MKRCPDCGWPMDGKTCQHCKLENYDNNTYIRYTSPAVIDKTLNTLEGIITGITIDNKLNSNEIAELNKWCFEHAPLANKMPYSELFDTIFIALEDDILTLEEQQDLLWLCQRLHSDGLYYDTVTSDMQKLHGILHGILADGKITKDELKGLQNWLADNEQLSTYYPYDEICSLVSAVLKDNVVTKEEENMLKAFFSQFAEINTNTNPLSSEMKQCLCKQGICALAPDITFEDHLFCFTGKSNKATRSEIANVVQEAGGKYHDSVIQKTNYLIVGNEGNTCWAFSCYGRKIEKAIELRKKGNHIMIINEIDFWDCM